MQMVRYDPWDVGELRNQINRLFSNLSDADSSGATSGWVPAVDIHEFDTRFLLYVDVPGVDPKEVEITLDNGVLTVAGERTLPLAPDGEELVHRRRERGHGRFFRRFILPDTVDADKVRAADRHGVLEISIPKQAKAQPRRIKIAA